MRRKISSIMDDNLYRRAKLEAVRQSRPLSEILSDALESYLARKRSPHGVAGVVSASRGAMKIDKKLLREIMEEEPDWFEAHWRP